MTVEQLPIFAYYNKQRFNQAGSMDCANWYGIAANDSKNEQALYPCMGRRHINFFGTNRLIFNNEPTRIFKSINYFYVIDGTSVFQVDKFYNQVFLGSIPLGSTVWNAFLPVGNLVYVMITTGTKIFVITENGSSSIMQEVIDTNAPPKALYVAAFGNRFVVSNANTPDYYLSQINLGETGFNPATAFTIPNAPGPGFPLFNRATGVIGQMGVLHNQLYIFNDYTTDIWANIPTQITVAGVTREFPWKLNSSYNWDYGIADPNSLSIDFGRITWLARNTSGLVTWMASNGQQPQDISTQAINVLLQNSDAIDETSPFIAGPTYGFLYQYENTILYRASAGPYLNAGELDKLEDSQSIEFNFTTQTWGRVIELNGERNRIQQHVFFNNKHFVTVLDDTAIYEMAGNIYYNELRTPNTDPQAINAFTKYPMRYELTTKQIFEEDYSEFITDYVQIDFVFGDMDFYKNKAPFINTIFIITEDAAPDGTPVFEIAEDQISGEDVFLIMEEGNTPTFEDNHYYELFKPHIELYYSDDGGITFVSADVREFSQMGQYRWLMRWNELNTSRNRVYRLICVSSAPIVILGGVQDRRPASGGAN